VAVKEFVTRGMPDVDTTLKTMEKRGIVRMEATSRVSVAAARPFALLLSMIWPFIDGYFVASVGLMALLPTGRVPDLELKSRMMGTLFPSG